MAIPVYILLGRTGAGKTRLAEAVKKKLGLPALHLGAMARAEVARGSTRGQRIEGLLARGGPIPTETALEMIGESIAANPRKFGKGFVIDNFPLSMEHMPLFEAFQREHGLNVAGVYHLHAPKAVADARRRERGARLGTSLGERERLFQQRDLKVIMHYKRRGLLRTLDATRSIKRNVKKIAKRHKAVKRAAKHKRR